MLLLIWLNPSSGDSYPRSKCVARWRHVNDHRFLSALFLPPLHRGFSKYKVFEANLSESRSKLKVTVPDIEASIECVEMLQRNRSSGQETTAYYPLADQVFHRANVPPSGTVCLWLGVRRRKDRASSLVQKEMPLCYLF